MASPQGFAGSVIHYGVSLYLIVCQSMLEFLNSLYNVIATASRAYPPARSFLTSCEKLVTYATSDSAAPAELSLQEILTGFWSATSVLDGLGRMSMAVPVSIAVLAGTNTLLAATLVFTTFSLVCSVVCVPMGICCGLSYSTVIVGYKFYGEACNTISLTYSTVRGLFSHSSAHDAETVESNKLDNAAVGTDIDGKGSQAPTFAADDSPRISAKV